MNLTLPEASSNAAEIDWLLLSLIGISLAVLALVFGLMFLYVVRYREASPISRGALGEKSFRFEITWTAVTLVLFFGLFLWGADLYVRLFEPPADTMKIYVVGKQWMWKAEHPEGQREINALHVPVDRDIQLLMTSEDVIHDFSVPAFRIKHDVLPGRYETVWFRPRTIGTYALYCTQFCGTDHAAMTGEIDVMSQPDFARWLATSGGVATLADEGRTLFTRYGCSGCHAGHGTVRAPSLAGLYGTPVPLSDGSLVTADDRYLRDAILDPGSQLVAGYQNIMPAFTGQVGEDDLIRLIVYIKSLAPGS